MESDEYYHGYKIRIYPTTEQAEYIDKCINANIYIYNWALDKELELYGLFYVGIEEYGCIGEYDLDAMFTKMRKETPWLQDIPIATGRSGIKRVVRAMKKFLKGDSAKPVYKKKKQMRKFSFITRAERMFFSDNMLRIEGLPGGDLIYTKWHSGFKRLDFIKFVNPVISRDKMNRYWISFNIKEKKPLEYFKQNKIPSLGRAIGIDLNKENRITLSTGEIFKAPDTSRLEKRIKRYQRKCQKDADRCSKLEKTNPDDGIQLSNRAKRRKYKLNKKWEKLVNINRNFIHTSTKRIIDMNPSMIVMEDLHVNDINKDHYVAKHVSRIGFWLIKETMNRKADKYNIPFKIADFNFKSTEICSGCGSIRKIHGKIYKCPVCGLQIDRDINAAINLERLAYN